MEPRTATDIRHNIAMVKLRTSVALAILGLTLLVAPIANAGAVNAIAREVAPGDWRLNYTSEFDLESINVSVVGPTAMTSG